MLLFLTAMTLWFPKQIQPRTLGEQAQFVAGWLSRHKAALGSVGSRFPDLTRVYIEGDEASLIAPNSPRFPLAVQAMIDMEELWYAIESVGDTLIDEMYLPVVKRALRDRALPLRQQTNTAGRDAQLELFVAAMFSRVTSRVLSGENALKEHGVIVGEGVPVFDWYIEQGSRAWQLETKRVKRPNSLQKRVEEACKQTNLLQRAAVLIIDFSVMANVQTNVLPPDLSEDALRDAGRKRMHNFMREFGKKLRHWTNGSTIGLIIFRDVLIQPPLEEGERWTTHGIWDCVHHRTEGAPSRAIFDDFCVLLNAALPQFV
jgi:hypothetical protein